MTSQELFVDVIRSSEELPSAVRDCADELREVSESFFDESYIHFLDEQIRLCPRGPEWTEILKRRRKALFSFCSIPLLCGRAQIGGSEFRILIEPESRRVVFWEEF